MLADASAECDSALEGFQVIYFGNDWFAENRTSSHHIARRLATHVPLLYVETPGSRAPQATSRDVKKLWRTLSAAFEPPRRVGPQAWVMTVPQIPFRKWPLVRRINGAVSRALLKRAQRLVGFRKTISWFVVPQGSELAGRLGEEFVVYYCIDDYAAFPHVDRVEVERQDRELTSRADQVFVASPQLVDGKKQLNPTTVHSPHGVDFDHFSQACDADLEIPPQIRNIRHPVIGFFGLIETWIDLDLIRHLASARPEWTFLMIGRVAVDLGELTSLPNVLFVGAQPYEDLPKWAAAFDVSIIPYRQTRQVFNANPLKLREYLATGKPVIAVRTPEIEKFSDHVRIADSGEQFLQHIDEALTEGCCVNAQNARMGAVKSMSWDARFSDVLTTIRRRMDVMSPIVKG
jgi:glycosyltransferase involved in cell wall biosynthesis